MTTSKNTGCCEKCDHEGFDRTMPSYCSDINCPCHTATTEDCIQPAEGDAVALYSVSKPATTEGWKPELLLRMRRWRRADSPEREIELEEQTYGFIRETIKAEREEAERRVISDLEQMHDEWEAKGESDIFHLQAYQDYKART